MPKNTFPTALNLGLKLCKPRLRCYLVNSSNLVGTGESLGEHRGDVTGDEYGAGLLLAGLRMNDFSFSGLTLP